MKELVHFSNRSKSMQTVCATLCKSGRFETGEGGCAAICMNMLGSSRECCEYQVRVHGGLAATIIHDLENK